MKGIHPMPAVFPRTPIAPNVNLRPENRRRLLDALELAEASAGLTREDLIRSTGLGRMTVYRAVQHMLDCGMVCVDAARHLHPLFPTPVAALDLSVHPLRAYLTLPSVPSGPDAGAPYLSLLPVEVEPRETYAVEEDLRLLLHRVRLARRSLPDDHLCPLLLLPPCTDGFPSPARLMAVLEEEMGHPGYVVDHQSATRYALSHRPHRGHPTSLLLLQAGERPEALLMIRSPSGGMNDWFVPPGAHVLCDHLRASLPTSPDHPGAWEDVCRVLGEAMRIFTPDETWIHPLPPPEALPADIRALLPATLPSDCSPALLGAVLMARRRLWEDVW